MYFCLISLVPIIFENQGNNQMNNKIKIIFLGYDYLGGQFLQVLLNEYQGKIEVAAVSTNGTQPKDNFSKKYRQAKRLWKKNLFAKELKNKIVLGKIINQKLLKNPPPSYNDITVRQLAEKHNIPAIDSQEILSGDTKAVEAYNADFIVVASFGKIPEAIYKNNPERVINFHPSYLPQLRGGSPLYSAIMRGMGQTGFSFHQLTQVFDAGPLRYQQIFAIEPSASCRQLEMAITIAGAHKLYDVLNGIANKTIGVIDISGREITKCFRNYEISTLLEPERFDTGYILRKIRACSSWGLGAAYICKGFRHFYITEAKPAQWDDSIANETIVYKEPEGLLIKTQDGAVLATQVYYKQKYYAGRELAQFKRALFDVVKN